MPTDPKVYAQVIEDLAYGLPHRVIAAALEVHESQLSRWKLKKEFARDLAAKKLEILRDPIKHIAEVNKLTFIERHPDTRELWRSPTQYSESTNKYEIKEIEITLVRPAPPCEDAGND